MIKARAGGMLLLGLSDRNLELLRQGKPIPIPLLPTDGGISQIVIFHGATEADMKRQLAPFITPETHIPGEEH